MSEEKLPRFIPPGRPTPTTASRAITSAFSLDPQFFVNLHEHLEKERVRANEQHRLILDGIRIEGKPGSSLMLMASPKELYESDTVPSVEQLSQLLQVGFWTSLEKEEGRPLHYTVNFMRPKPDDDLFNQTLIAFDEPLLYRIRELTKLAPAAGSTSAALLVAPFGGGELKIWGLRDHSFDPLRIKVIDPGSVVVKFGDTNVAAISRSEAIQIRDPLFTRSSVIWSRFDPNKEGTEYNQWTDPRINAVLETVKRMRSLGHGGTLIIVPAEGGWRDSVKLPITYSGSKSHNPFRYSIPKLKELIGQRGHTWTEESYYWSLTTEACKLLSHLTAVDGATVITYDLDVIGFGAKLQSKSGSNEPPVIYNVDPLDHENWIARVKFDQLGGTRHQSAARFVADQQDAIAFVVSQDGDVSAFVCWQSPSEGVPSLYAHRRLELTLF